MSYGAGISSRTDTGVMRAMRGSNFNFIEFDGLSLDALLIPFGTFRFRRSTSCSFDALPPPFCTSIDFPTLQKNCFRDVLRRI